MMKPQKSIKEPVEGDLSLSDVAGPFQGRPLVSIDSAILKDVRVALQAKLGQATLSVADLLALKSGSVVTLDMKMTDLIELRLNDALVARGEIVAVDDSFGIRIVEVARIA